MRAVVRTPTGEREVLLTAEPGATVAELAAALGSAGSPVWLDGVVVSPGDPLAALGDGSVVHVGCAPAAPPPYPGVAEVALVGGLDAGRRVPLAPGSHALGRSGPVALASPTVSRRHADLAVAPSGAVAVRDAGSRNGTRVDGAWALVETPLAPDSVVTLGACHAVVRPVAAPPARGRTTHNRPPRPPAPAAPAALRLPAAAPARGERPRFSWAAVLVPVVLGAVLVVLLGNLTYAVLTLLGPVMVVANWAEERRRRRADTRTDGRREASEVAAFRSAVAGAHAAERRRRRAASPDLAALLAVAEAAAPTLWERRPAHDDHLRLALGLGTLPWRPPLDPAGGTPAPGAEEVLAAYAALPDVPVTADLRPGRVLGVAGDRAAALALARGLLAQAAVLHGPADLRTAVLTRDPAAWRWAAWLPHARTDGTALVGAAPDDVLAALGPGPHGTLLVVDDPALTAGRPAPVRDLLASGTVAGLVLADRIEQLPSSCTDVVTVDADGAATLAPGTAFLAAGLDEPTARRCARALARVDDPEAGTAVATADTVTLLPLLDLDRRDVAAALADRWRAAPPGSLAVPVGVTDAGPFVLDLVADGPHALVAGTTGSGKSELLRTLVASLAATRSPDDLTFVLVDYKGGSAFADCARLPHVVGFVTDLDEHLGARALACLEAELRHRERLLRDAGTPDLLAYAAAGRPLGPLPRLVVVVDEFATLAAELPGFVDSLVGVAQRGRSLGVHLVLATQRPNGAVNDNIRANTGLRVALRVQDPGDSTDVVGSPVAADLSRRRPGRGYARLGPDELTAFQAALVSAPSPAGGPRVAVRDLDAPAVPAAAEDLPTDLALLVAGAVRAAVDLGLAPPRLPWPPPLPATVPVPETPLPAHGWSAPIGLADEPDRQRQVPYEWTSAGGNLFLYGVTGSGTSAALVTLGLSLARRYDAASLHLYALDFGTAALAPLADLPHTGAVLQPPERERHVRLVRRLRAEVARRQERFRAAGVATIDDYNAAADPLPAIVLLVDGWAAFEAAYDDVPGLAVRDDLVRVVADGPGLGVYVVATGDRPMAIPVSVAALAPRKLVLRLADAPDYATFGLRVADLPSLGPGRAVDVTTGREVQLADPPDPPAAPAPVDPARLPAPVGALPDRVNGAGRAVLAGDAWLLPAGIGDTTLRPVHLTLRPGEPALVAGPPRSGRSGLLAALAASLAGTDVLVTAVAYRPSPLRESPHLAGVVDDPAELPALLAALAADPRRHLLLVDDAEHVADPDLAALVAERRPNLRVVAAGRADVLRTAYGHWTEAVRRSRHGVLLRPRTDVDGDLFGVALPRHGPARFGTGRGYLVGDGETELFQAVTT
jgi:S-DNA-T family DNA segregation ATPase FtsK/SpoIIIE